MEQFMEGLKITGVGLATVFLVLAIFYVIITLLQKVIKNKE